MAHAFFVDNMLKAPPFVSDVDLKEAGPFARHGPGPVSREVSNQAPHSSRSPGSTSSAVAGRSGGA